MFLLNTVSGRFDIRDFGAIPNDDSLAAEEINSAAIMQAIVAANYTSVDEREVYIPSNLTFSSMPVYANFIQNLIITIDGTLIASKRNNMWPLGKKDVLNFIELNHAQNFKIRGNGTVDG